ncbi:RWD domain-containing protein 1 [Branchiostoma belcheri]|nr:RWD domain-containing protein 1 [Branchiostoma belcheri]
MTDYAEEQDNEIEALESIYPDILEVLETEPHCFKLSLSAESDSHEEGAPLGVDLQFTYVPTYPDAPPEMEVLSPQNLTEQDVSSIQDLLQQQAEENLGMVMVFTLVSAVQERLGKQLFERDTSLNDSDARFLDNEDITLGAGDESVEERQDPVVILDADI